MRCVRPLCSHAPSRPANRSTPHPQGKQPARLEARCGQCKTCLRPSLCKPCLGPVPRGEAGALAAGESAK